jgi:plasmid segregation protein ParM
MSSKNIVFAGVDDGHREIDVVLSTGFRNKTPSRAMSGLSNRISISGDRVSVFSYSTSEGQFSMGDVENGEDTAYDDYPFSAQNRVIVAHALRQANLPADTELYVVSGLPLKRFYLSGKPHKIVIDKKKANLTKHDVVGLDGFKPAKIVRHEVVAEAIAAWVNYVMVRKNDNSLYIDKERVAKRIAIIDVGGRTLDIAVVKDWDLDTSRSTSDEIGMITIIEGMRERLYDLFGGVQPTDEMVEQAVETGFVSAWGKLMNVKEIREDVIMSVVNSLRATIKRRLKSAQDIDSVFFIGGTAKFLEKYLNGWFPNQVVVDSPEYANAEGMLKYAEFVLGKS